MDDHITIHRRHHPGSQAQDAAGHWDRLPAFNCLLHRDALLAYIKALPATVAAQVWLTDALGTEDLGLSRACDLLDPILPCFVQDPDERQHILDETRDRIMRFADAIADLESRATHSAPRHTPADDRSKRSLQPAS